MRPHATTYRCDTKPAGVSCRDASLGFRLIDPPVSTSHTENQCVVSHGHELQHHDEYGEKIDKQLNVSYAEAACLIDNHVINTEE